MSPLLRRADRGHAVDAGRQHAERRPSGIDVDVRAARGHHRRRMADPHDDVLGSLTPGKYADFVVLSANPQAVDPAAIAEIGVCQTRVAGAVTWTAP